LGNVLFPRQLAERLGIGNGNGILSFAGIKRGKELEQPDSLRPLLGCRPGPARKKGRRKKREKGKPGFAVRAAHFTGEKREGLGGKKIKKPDLCFAKMFSGLGEKRNLEKKGEKKHPKSRYFNINNRRRKKKKRGE